MSSFPYLLLALVLVLLAGVLWALTRWLSRFTGVEAQLLTLLVGVAALVVSYCAIWPVMILVFALLMHLRQP